MDDKVYSVEENTYVLANSSTGATLLADTDTYCAKTLAGNYCSAGGADTVVPFSTDNISEAKSCILKGYTSSNPLPYPGKTFNTGVTKTTFVNTDNIWSYVYIYVSKVHFAPATKYEWSSGKVTLTVTGQKDGVSTNLGTFTGNGPYDYTDEDFNQYKVRLDIKDYDEIVFGLSASGVCSDNADQAYSALSGKAKYELH